ncbi:hypothetical protein AJ78_01930 [Emergomyces pasteurianus Ep9510]|uniref:Rhodopsin domain-containing protein n=1 Tax=Emergomyces pasteurianus Ep9510 TaxID=1447872 RepID=A0A1J9PPE8_9EURO|nr:hypothetical protein AJ78_01930 [Emergomyces pasteurianus Ep9510]
MAMSRALPPRISEPLAVDTNNDHGGLIAIITAMFLGFALVSLGIRAYVRHSRHVVKKDDYALLAAMILFCIQSSVVFVQIGYGWGKSRELLTPRPQIGLFEATYAADMIYVLTHCVSKSSAALFYVRISPNRCHVLIAWGLVGLSVIWAAISMTLISLRCDHTRPWMGIGSHCLSLFPRWQFIGAFDIITEVGLSTISLCLVTSVQMAASRKIIVVLAFSSRLLVVLPASFHIHYIKRMLDSSDPTLVGSYVTVCQQLELSYGIIANTIPCLKPFMAAYEETGRPSYRNRYHSNSGSQSNSGNSKASHGWKYSRDSHGVSMISSPRVARFKNLWASNTTTTDQDSVPPPPPPPTELAKCHPPRVKPSQSLEADSVRYTATVKRGGRERDGISLESDDNKRLTIKKDVNWNVESSEMWGRGRDC